MNDEEKNQYANWLFEECSEPISEVEWLVSNLPLEIQNSIKNSILKHLNNRNKL
jgi:hypothetical protein